MGDAVYSVDISENGEYIAAGSYDGQICLFGKQNSEPIWCYEVSGIIKSVSISSESEIN